MEIIIVYALFIAAINYIVVESEIFTPIRNFIKDKKIPLLHRSVDCTACTGIQLGVLFSICINNLVLGIAAGFLSYIILDLQYNISLLANTKLEQNHKH